MRSCIHASDGAAGVAALHWHARWPDGKCRGGLPKIAALHRSAESLITSGMPKTFLLNVLRAASLVTAGAFAATLGGCASGPSEESVAAGAFTGIAAAEYQAAFAAARDVLRDNRFSLERVDAGAGVITTQRSTTMREAVDVIQRRARFVVVSFASAAGAEPAGDVRDASLPLAMTVKVVIERIEVPGWQIPPSSVRLASRTSDPEKAAAELEPLYTVAVGEDKELAAALAGQIRRKLGQ